MKLTTPQISWHGKEPVLSVDFCKIGSTLKFASAGADNDVKIWSVSYDQEGKEKLEFLANLSRHNKAVNVVRFSPNEELLASGGDDCCVILWKLSVNQEKTAQPLKDSDEDIENRESWTANKVLRGHIEDVYDIAWSPDGSQLISGSVDNSAIIWDVAKGTKLMILKDHKHYIQGVCWDPLGQYVVTNSSDRSCRLYNSQSYRCCYNINKLSGTANIKIPDGGELKQLKMFHDESLLSFFRRPTFTPDGSLLIVPAGRIEMSNQVLHTTYVFTRGSPKPVLYLPSPKKPTVAVRCCPVLFNLKTSDKESEKENEQESAPLFKLAYRMVFAIASLNSIFLYDTQHKVPFGYISNIHYSGISDITWSNDGSVLVVSSTDGYCSLVHFDDNELGTPYKKTVKEVLDKPITTRPFTPENSGKTSEKVLNSVQKMEIDEEAASPDNEMVVKKRDTPSIAKFTVPLSQLPQNSAPTKDVNKVTPRRVQLFSSSSKPANTAPLTNQANISQQPVIINTVNQPRRVALISQPSNTVPQGQPRRVPLTSVAIAPAAANQAMPIQSNPGDSSHVNAAELVPQPIQPVKQAYPVQQAQPTLAQSVANPTPRRVELVPQPFQPVKQVHPVQQVQPTLAQSVTNPTPRRVELVPQPIQPAQLVKQALPVQQVQSTLAQSVSNPTPRRVVLVPQPIQPAQPVKQALPVQQAQSTLAQSVTNPTPRRVVLVPQPIQPAKPVKQAQPVQQVQPTLAQSLTNPTPRRVELVPQPVQPAKPAKPVKQAQPVQQAQPTMAQSVSQPTQSTECTKQVQQVQQAQPTSVQSISNPTPGRVGLVSQPLSPQVSTASSAQQIASHSIQENQSAQSVKQAQTTLLQSIINPIQKKVDIKSQPLSAQASPSNQQVVPFQTQPAKPVRQAQPMLVQNAQTPRRVELMSQPTAAQASSSKAVTQIKLENQPEKPGQQIQPTLVQNAPTLRKVELMSQPTLAQVCTNPNQQIISQKSPETTSEARKGTLTISENSPSQRARNPIPLEPVVIILE